MSPLGPPVMARRAHARHTSATGARSLLGRLSGALLVVLLLATTMVALTTYDALRSPASAAEPNQLTKTGVAQSPAGSTAQTNEGTLVDWTLRYDTDSTVVQPKVSIVDTGGTNMSLVPSSVQAPQGWTPATVVNPAKVTFTNPAVAPGGKGVAISTEPQRTNLSGGSTGGDGFVPLFGSDGRIYLTYHHRPGIIQCIEPSTGTACSGFPVDMNIASGG